MQSGNEYRVGLRGRRNLRGESGFTYLWLLMLIGLMGIGLSVAGQVWAISARRDKEADLMAIGREFKEAIRRYRAFTPGNAQGEYPKSLEDLLRDPRAPGVVRHLRRIYVDPMTGKAEWGLIRMGDRIVGVHSLATGKPLKTGGFEEDLLGLEGKETYEQWAFVVMPEGGAPSGSLNQVPLQPSPRDQRVFEK